MHSFIYWSLVISLVDVKSSTLNRCVFVTMDVIFHETIHFCQPCYSRVKALKVKKLSFLSLAQLSLQDVQDISDEATTNWIDPTTVRKKKTNSSAKNIKEGNSPLWLHVNKSCLTQKVRIPLDNNEKISVIQNVLNILFLNIYALRIYLINIKVLLLLLMIQKFPPQSNKAWKMNIGIWTHTMREEMTELERKSTWKIVDKPIDERVAGSKKPWKLNIRHEREDEYVGKKLNMVDCRQTKRQKGLWGPRSHESEHWTQVMIEEINALERSSTWQIVE